jgi:hypothetical protein
MFRRGSRLRHSLAQAYRDLGRTTFALVQQGALADGRLAVSAASVP